jgi:hypothetical protein
MGRAGWEIADSQEPRADSQQSGAGAVRTSVAATVLLGPRFAGAERLVRRDWLTTTNKRSRPRLGIGGFPLMDSDGVSIRIKNRGHMAPRELYRFDDEPASTHLQFLGRRFKILDLQRD